MVKILVLLSLLMLTACTTASGTFCDLAKPFRFSDSSIDALQGDEVTALLEHNEKGRRLCGWKPQG